MLFDQYLNQPYQPKLSYFIGGFDVCHREDTLSEELGKYDPNDPVDRDLLIRRYCLELPRRENFRHRTAQFDLLESALANPDFDFASIWEDDEDEFYTWTWPHDWPEITAPRDLFQAIRDIAQVIWYEDLQRSNLPTLQSCRAIPERDLGSYDWLFCVDNSGAWKEVFDLAVTPSDLKTRGSLCLRGGLKLSVEGYLNSLMFRPSHWPASSAFTFCELDLSVTGIGEMEVRGSQFDGPLRASLTRLQNGCYLRMEIGVDCVIECVALHVKISNVVGSHRTQKYGCR